MFYLAPPSIFTIDPFINLFFEEIKRLIKSIKSSGLPIFSTESLFFTIFLTLSGLETIALYQLLFFAAIMLVLIQLIKILFLSKIMELFFT